MPAVLLALAAALCYSGSLLEQRHTQTVLRPGHGAAFQVRLPLATSA
jgi:hypothetical protein